MSKNNCVLSTKLFFLVYCIFFSMPSSGINTNKEGLLRKAKSSVDNEAIVAMHELAVYYQQVEGASTKSDSMALLAIELSEKINNKKLVIKSYQVYSTYCLPDHIEEADEHLRKGFLLCEKINDDELLFQITISSAKFKEKKGQLDEAIKEVISTKKLTADNDSRNFIYHITLGDLFSNTKDTRSALENYNTALEYAYELNQDSLAFQSYLKLIEFTLQNKLYNKTNEYLEKAFELVEIKSNFNDYDKFYLKILEQELLANTQTKSLLKNGIKLIKEARTKKYLVLENIVYGILRISFMKNDDIKSLCLLYCDTNTASHFKKLEDEQPDLYFRIRAFIAEDNNKIDSANTYWKRSESLVIKDKANTYISNFYIRYGQFHVRQQHKSQAVDAFKKAYEFALKSNFLPMAIESSSRLDSAYYAMGDIPNAYIALRNNKIFIDSNTKILQQEKLNILEQNSSKRLDLITERIKKEAEERSNRLQLYLIGLFIFGLIFLLIFLSKKAISAATFKLFGYITFVFLFEFFIFLLHNFFHSITHSPIWLMMMNVTLIALLLPIHHATEHRVLHYLLKRNRVEHRNDAAFPTIKNLFEKYKNWLKVKEDEDEHEEQKEHTESLV